MCAAHWDDLSDLAVRRSGGAQEREFSIGVLP